MGLPIQRKLDQALKRDFIFVSSKTRGGLSLV